MAGHTKGEWEVAWYSGVGSDIPYAAVISSPRRTIAQFNIDLTAREECEANARLIAAAPDLLEALRACHAMLNGETDRQADDDTTEMVLAAIAKATGTEVPA